MIVERNDGVRRPRRGLQGWASLSWTGRPARDIEIHIHIVCFASAIACAKIPSIVNGLHHLLHIKSRLVYMLLAVFIANILAAGPGFSASPDWFQHEKNHLAALQDTESPDSPQSAPDKPTGKTQNKHDCHTSHFFQSHVSTTPLVFPRVSSPLPPVFYLALAPQGFTGAPFRPPR
jgi:hypothetical protein